MTLRLFVPHLPGAGVAFDLPETAARHAQVRRVQPGEGLVLFDGGGGEWQACVERMGRLQVQVRLLRHQAVDREASREVILAPVVPAGERMDWLVEKSTELGVSRLCPLHSERSVLRLSGERAERKREHWQAVAVAAAEQCGRTRVPRVDPVRTLGPFLADPPAAAARWLASPAAAAGLPAGVPTSVLLLTGPEGGFSAAEEGSARGAGFAAVGLGPRILRADTAPVAVLAWLSLSP